MEPRTAPSRRDVAVGIVFRILGGVGWAGSLAVVKYAGEHGANVVQMLAARNVAAFSVIAAFVISTAGPKSLYTTRLPMHASRALMGILGLGLSFSAILFLPLTEATAIGFTAPLWITLLSGPLLQERVGPRRWAAVAIGFLGVLIMVRPDPANLANLGALLGLGAAFCGAVSTLGVRELTRTERGPTIVFYFLGFSALATLLPLPFFWAPLETTTLLALLGLGVVSALVQSLLTQSVRLAPPAVVSPFDYTQLISASVIGWLVWNEHLRAATLLGAVIVAGCGLFILWSETRRPKPQPIPPDGL